MLFQKRLVIISLIILWADIWSINILLGQGFSDASSEAGITLVHNTTGINDHKMGTGAAWLDYNKDGYLDLYVTMRVGANKLFKNNGPDPITGIYNFDEVAGAFGVDDANGDGGGVSIADINNDGWDDIFLANCSGNRLFRNNGPDVNGVFSFTDIISSAFVDGTAGGNSRSPSASWGDYDNDGFLDLYVAQHYTVLGASGGTTQDFLYHNNGNETFSDISNLLVVDSLMGGGFIGGWSDYDKDGDLDIFLINDCPIAIGKPTMVWRNDGGSDPLNWNFTEVSDSIGMDDCRNGMGIGVGDYNRDGWMDIFYTNIGDCVMYSNDADGTFSDVSNQSGIDIQPAQHYSWGAAFMDYDNDGWQDIMVSIGALSLNPSPGFPYNQQPNMFFRNNGDSTFTEMATPLGLNDDRQTRSGIYGDYDNDGDLDLYVTNYEDNCVLNKNNLSNGKHWIKIHLSGTQGNQDGLGSKLKLTTSDGTIQYYETRSGSNLGGGDSPYAHFGLDTNTVITELEIKWLSGEVQVINNLSVDQLLQVVEPLAPLPIELISFSARQENDIVTLEWKTASEYNNDYFIIQRSNDGNYFTDFEKIQGRGTTTFNTDYQSFDLKPLQGDNYYRLKQLDYNGNFDYSEIRLVNFKGKNTTINVFPNPITTGNLNLKFSNTHRNTIIEIRDILGRIVFQRNVENEGNQIIEISTNNWKNGIYLVRVFNITTDQKVKVVLNN